MQLERVVEIKVCKHCSASFDITDKDLEFYDKVSPIFAWVKYQIPTPTLCPDCRQQRRLSYRLETKLYKRKCDFSWKDLISMYSPDKNDIVYNYDIWWSDKWDAMDYWVDFDFSKSFFEQLFELSLKVPKAHIEISPSENSTYTNQAWYNKNCYLVFEAWYDEDCIYSNSIWYSKNSIDCSFVNWVENCYECVDVKKSFNLFFSQKCNECRDSQYLFDCHNCKNCFGCWNLTWKEYFILNKQYTKQDYEKFVSNFSLDINTKQNFINELKQAKKTQTINKNLDNIFSENVSGNNIIESKNCSWFDISKSEECYNSYSIYSSKDCKDFSYWWNNVNLIYDSISIWNTANNVIFSYMCFGNVSNLLYCLNCANNVSNCFWCVWLKNKSYCILNKQYTKEQYEELVPKIIEHMINFPSPYGRGVRGEGWEWWEFFPASISPFGYNETIANEYFPVSPHPDLLPSGEGVKGIIKNNQFIPLPLGEVRWGQNIYNRSDYEAPFPKVDKIIPANMLPLDISKIPDDILNRAIECEITKKPFKIIKQELDFYRKHNLPIPKRHPDQRHLDRMALRNPRKLFDRKCAKCGKDIKTTYNPDRKEIVYCEECYEKSVY